MSNEGEKDPGVDSAKLLDDEAFAGMMEAAWKKEGAPVDQTAKTRVWNRLMPQLSEKKPLARTKWQVPVLLAAGLAGLVVVSRSFFAPISDDSGQQVKGLPGAVELRVGFYLQEKEGELLPWNPSQRQPGEIIVPFVEVKSTAAVTLLRKTGEEAYEMVADAQWAKTGFEHYFAAGDETTAIELEVTPETYCVLATNEMQMMGQIIPALPTLDIEGRPVTLECFEL